MEFWCETHLGVDRLRDTSLILEMPSDDWTWCANPIERRRLPQGFHGACPMLLATLVERHQFKPRNIEPYLLSRSLRRAQLKIEDLIAELAVFPLNNKIHVKVDGEIRYIRELKIKEPSQDVVVVEVL